jgi:dipeptidyl aminopeptidase/acylaminoacyl peptidase
LRGRGTDLDMLCLTSDWPYLEADMVGGPSWDSRRDDKVAENASAIRRIGGKGVPEAMPRVLILHSREDKRIPVSQATAFHAACKAYGVEVEMAVYPRERHLMREGAHLVDLLGRVERFCGKPLS